jgi:hypothetical protein
METEKKLNQWNITMESGLKMSMDRIPRTLHTNMRIKSKVTIVKLGGGQMYLLGQLNKFRREHIWRD